jgi:alpha-ketoglutarate-dependent taurine dioxygenase
MSFKVDSLGNGSAKLITSKEITNIFDLPVPEIQDLFKKNGVLLFRGFNVAPEQLEAFASKYSAQFIHEGARMGFAGYVEEVDQGNGPLPLHSESANSPFRPELVWFCCQKTATSGGQTLICDGVALLEDLGDEAKELFSTKKIKYKRNYKPDIWKRFAQPNGTLEDLERVLAPIPGVVKIALNDDDSVYSEYVVSAIPKTKFGGMRAFANTVIGSYRGAYQGIEMVFDDDSEIPVHILDEAVEVGEQHSEEIVWEDGDVAMIDNSRFMHGRRSFYDDTQRRLMTALSFANF